tara:strand:- start:395 stop:532 length:138 start_codon:yes stop_codon:yes gene_type:complete
LQEPAPQVEEEAQYEQEGSVDPDMGVMKKMEERWRILQTKQNFMT